MWQVTFGMWHDAWKDLNILSKFQVSCLYNLGVKMTFNIWHLTCDTWRMTCDMWQMEGGEHSLKMSDPWSEGVLKTLEQKDYQLTDLNN